MNHKMSKYQIYKLIDKINKQRKSLNTACTNWLNNTTRYDRIWMILLNIRRYLTLISSILAVISIKSPYRLIRWIKRGFGLWGLWRIIKSIMVSHHISLK
ncbi:YqjK-like family protein [Pantoea sp. Aalb]|uniref:YqjK-like family protein n=1 Tax=Pantoea sp. Aalb TaxID=2576762 RepID=UPI001322032D|nr:YqjK-like family protein [Pantoea sp. Aalb]MXP67695.1 hypothetical protein [Pantoea sp. Aalb]